MDPSSEASFPPHRNPVRSLLSKVQDLSAMNPTDLDGLLSRIVEVAAEMTGARYAAMGVLSEEDPMRLAHFVTHGLSNQERREIGDPPRGTGVLGRMMRNPTGVRLVDVMQEPDAVGFPAGHPPMRTLLGMPIRIGSTVFGDLYVTEKDQGRPFTDEDQVMLEALTVVAGGVIDLTRQRLEAQSHRAMSETIRAINRALLVEDDPAHVMPLVLTQARRLRQAEAAAVFTTGDDKHNVFDVVAAQGAGVDELLEEARSHVLHSLSIGTSVHWTDAESPSLLCHGTGARYNSVVPVRVSDGTWAVLLVMGWMPATRVTHRYTEGVLEALGDQVGLVMDRVAARHTHDVLMQVDDRERIARDLHDLVIQRIFAAGLTLQGATRLDAPPEVQERIERTIGELDATIRDIRSTIFALTPARNGTSVQENINQLITSYALTLGFSPVLVCDEMVEEVLTESSRLALLLVVREALSNVARHAHATSVEVAVRVEVDQVVVVVTDDGVGLPDKVAESGLGNVRTRALQHGGSMDLMARTPGGTVLRWRVPLQD